MGQMDYYKQPLTESQYKRHSLREFEVLLLPPSEAKKIQFYYDCKVRDGHDVERNHAERLRLPEKDPGTGPILNFFFYRVSSQFEIKF